MRALTLDFQQQQRRPSWRNIALLAGGLFMAAFLGLHSLQQFSKIRVLQAQQATLEHRTQRRAPVRLPADEVHRLRNEITQARQVLAQLALPWEHLFTDIDSSPNDRVAVLAIEPDAVKHLVSISGEARDFTAMLNYLRALQNKDSLTGVYLQSHHIEQQTAEHPVRFVVLASWVIK
jgi:Tfp pilus assembly protein PilN